MDCPKPLDVIQALFHSDWLMSLLNLLPVKLRFDRQRASWRIACQNAVLTRQSQQSCTPGLALQQSVINIRSPKRSCCQAAARKRLHVFLPATAPAPVFMLLCCCSCRIPWPTKPGAHRYPEALHKLVGFCLQVDPARRPTVSQVLQYVDDMLSQPGSTF